MDQTEALEASNTCRVSLGCSGVSRPRAGADPVKGGLLSDTHHVANYQARGLELDGPDTLGGDQGVIAVTTIHPG
jgi:hypothetical protein